MLYPARQKQAAGEVEAKRKEKEEMHSAAADNEIDIPMNDETAQAATKIQAKFRRSALSSGFFCGFQQLLMLYPARQKQAAGEVDAKRKEKEQMHDATDNEIDIPMDDETAQAATKIQAKFRWPTISCCCSFSLFAWLGAWGRQKQAASEVEAMRKEKLKSESGDAAEAEPSDVDRFETDVDIEQAELARPAVTVC